METSLKMDDTTFKILEKMLNHRMRPPIVLKKFLHDYKQALEDDMIPHTESDIQIAMNLSEESTRFERAQKKCSMTHLLQKDDANIVEFIPGQPEAQRIQPIETSPGVEKPATFKILKENQTNNSRNPFRRTTETYKLAPFPNTANIEKMEQSNKVSEPECDYYNDLLLSIRMYRPSRATHVGRDLEQPVFAESFQCLGSNFLTELRDKITCVCNKYHFYDISEEPETLLTEKSIDPGFFFIGDKFYNDHRIDENPDYSSLLLKWAKLAKGIKEAKFKTAKMEEARFIDLSINLGFPQLYQHHGNCEHLFTFSQVDLLTPSLTFNMTMPRSLYPRLHSFGVYNNRLCNMCGNMHYVFVVENSDRQLHDPAYLCSKCFHTFHYVDGKKIGKFKAYRIQNYNESVLVLNENSGEDESQGNNESTDSESTTAEKAAAVTEQTIETADETFRVVINENNIDIVLVKEEQQ